MKHLTLISSGEIDSEDGHFVGSEIRKYQCSVALTARMTANVGFSANLNWEKHEAILYWLTVQLDDVELGYYEAVTYNKGEITLLAF